MTDAIDLSSVLVTGGADPRGWPITTTITSLATSKDGIEAQFSKRASDGWPDIVPATWDGPVYYTVWLGAELSDGVHLAASLNVYRGLAGSGAGDVTNIGQYSQNLWYLDPALKAHVVTEGETLYLMVTAGGLRGISAISVQERSNVVAFQASSQPRTFNFGATPSPVDPVDKPPLQAPPCDLSPVLAKLDAMQAAIFAHDDANTEKVQQQLNQIVQQVAQSLKALDPLIRILKR